MSTMRAIVHRRYGTPDVLALEEIDRPSVGETDVRIRVHAACASIGDHHVVTGKPYLIRLSPYGGFPGPKHRVPGTSMAGRVESVGARITAFQPGDEVFGQAARGAFAEYAVIPATLVATKPANLSFEEAAAIPWGTTALQGLRDAGGVTAGQRILVNGASGGVGTWAVQIGKALGAHVTAVCSTRNVEMVRALGADEVIDYTRDDFVRGGTRFDVMMDLIGNRSLSDCRSTLKPGGTYVPCSAGGGDWIGPFTRILSGMVTSILSRRKFKTFLQTPDREDLVFLADLVETGRAKPVIERTYPLGEVAAALRHVGEGHARGQTVIRLVP